MMGTIHPFSGTIAPDLRGRGMDVQANPFRGLIWGCVVSSVLWIAIFLIVSRVIDWIASVT